MIGGAGLVRARIRRPTSEALGRGPGHRGPENADDATRRAFHDRSIGAGGSERAAHAGTGEQSRDAVFEFRQQAASTIPTAVGTGR